MGWWCAFLCGPACAFCALRGCLRVRTSNYACARARARCWTVPDGNFASPAPPWKRGAPQGCGRAREGRVLGASVRRVTLGPGSARPGNAGRGLGWPACEQCVRRGGIAHQEPVPQQGPGGEVVDFRSLSEAGPSVGFSVRPHSSPPLSVSHAARARSLPPPLAAQSSDNTRGSI